jgi:drug/metabolite transporter (DMT)-like permease
MEHTLLIAILAGLGGMLGWGLADLFAKKTIDTIGDIVSLAWAHIFGTIVFGIAALYQVCIRGQALNFPHELHGWLLLCFFGVLQAAVYLLVYKGFAKGQVSVLNPIFASFSGIVAIVSVIFLGEVVSGYMPVALVVIFIGVLLLSIDISALKARTLNFIVPGFKEVALATLLASFWTLSWNAFIGGADWLAYAFSMYAFMTAAILLYAKIGRIKLAVPVPGMWKFLVLIGACETVAYLAISLGYSLTDKTTVVALLSGAFSLPTIILARAFLKEKVSAAQTIGGIVVIIGIILLSLL